MKAKCKDETKNRSQAERILALLAEADGWRSGEELAEILRISRAAVAKHVGTLRREGNVIQSRTHKGYFLEIRAETIRRGAVEKRLTTQTLGRNEWRLFPETGSTNSEAITLALAGAPEGTVVTAERQTLGKGRKGHGWFSSPRGLHVSVILRPQGKRDNGDAATRAALTAMGKAIMSLTKLKTEVKKPNDLFLAGKKVSGILAETGYRGDEPDWLVLGAGCNVNTLLDDFPSEIREKVTSLYLNCGEDVSKNQLLAEYLNQLDAILFPR